MHQTDSDTSGDRQAYSDANDAKKLADTAERLLGATDVIEMQKNYEDLMRRWGVLYARPQKKLLTIANTFP